MAIAMLLTLYFLPTVFSTELRETESVYPLRIIDSIPLLSCYTCSSNSTNPDSNCVTMTETSNITVVQCHLHEPFCKVRRLSENSRVHLLDRSCTKSCVAGCHKYGNIEHCRSCCTQPLCNVGNRANKLFYQTFKQLWLILLILVI